MGKKKDPVITLMRSVAIILVVLQHALKYSANQTMFSFAKVCYAIDVNVFFFISGYLFEGKKNSYIGKNAPGFIIKKTRELLIPYFSWNLLIYFGVYFAYITPGMKRILEKSGLERFTVQEIFVNIFTFDKYYLELYWFIYLLFIIFMIAVIKERKVNTYVYFGAVVIGLSALQSVNGNYLINKMCVSLIMFEMGRIVHRRNLFEQLSNSTMLACSILLTVIFQYRRFNVPIKTVGYEFFYYIYWNLENIILGLAGVVICVFVAQTIKQLNYVKKIFLWIGEESFRIYLIHNPYVVAVSFMVCSNFMTNTVAVLTTTIASIVLPPFIYSVLKRIPSVPMLFFGET